jgi:hypothetical protein
MMLQLAKPPISGGGFPVGNRNHQVKCDVLELHPNPREWRSGGAEIRPL